MFSRDASLDEVVAALNAQDFDAVELINAAVKPTAMLQVQHPASVDLRVQIDGYSQEIASALQTQLEALQRSEKRLPHQIDLLRSDVRAFGESQGSEVAGIASIIASAARDPALAELERLSQVRERIEQVRRLLEAARGSARPDAETVRQLAAAFRGTPDEKKFTQGEGYYDLFNKIMK